MLFYFMMLETKGILARNFFFPPGKQRLTYPIKSHKREDRSQSSLGAFIGIFAVIPLVNGMAGTAFSASADADRRDSEADRDICIGTSCAFEFYIFAACLERRGCGAHDLTVLRLASCRTVSNLFYFHCDTSVVIEAVLRFFVGTLGFPTVIFILNCTFDALLKLCIKLFKLL